MRRTVFTRVVRRLPFCIDRGRVLDVGSGTGFYIDCWKEAGCREVEGCDMASVAFVRLMKKYPDCRFYRIDIGDSLSDAIPPGFDAISAMDVMFHIVDDGKFERALHNVYRLLRPGGVFIWSGNFLHGSAQRKKHIVHRSLANTVELLDKVGFEVLDRRPLFYLMNEPLDAENSISPTLWNWIYRASSKSELLGDFVGGLLYPLEIGLVSLRKESPSTEIMICRRPAK